jgi:GT2 family glycosyltransferase
VTSRTHPQDPPSEDLARTPARAAGDVGDPGARPDSAVVATTLAPTGVATPAVTAILVLRNGAPWLPDCLDGLAAQRRAPERLVAVDIASSDGSAALVSSHQSLAEAIPRVEVVSVDADASFAGAVQAGIARLGPDAGSDWLWLLHDDSAPEPDALTELVGAVRRSPSVGMAGPKVLEWERPRRLLEVGHQLTATGRRIFAPAPGERDQGQYDERTDVLAVGSCGMLVRRSIYTELGGLDAGYPDPADSLDLGWRTQLAGHRVVVVPEARVRHVDARYDLARSTTAEGMAARRAHRSAARRVALARCSPWVLPFLSIWVVVSSVVTALALLLLKRPAHAWVELGDIGALAHPISSIRSRWAFRRLRRLRRRDLATVFVSTGESVRHLMDKVHEALTPDRDADEPVLGTGAAAAESGPVAEEADNLTVLPASLPQRVLTNPGFLAIVAAGAASAYGLRQALRAGVLDAEGYGLVGGELQRVVTGSAGLWHTYRDAWSGAGWGGPADTGPGTGVLAALVWLGERLPYVADGRSPASVVLAWLLLLGMPLATGTAYLASRVIPAAGWLRAVVALAWGTGGVALAALSSGRVTVLLAQILLPLVAAGVVRSVAANATFTAAAATGLGAAILAALVPLFLVVIVVVAAVIVAVGPGLARRVRGLAILAIPIALLLPWLPQWRDPAVLLGAPGLLELAPAPAVSLGKVALGFPDGIPTWVAILAIGLYAAAGLALLRRPRSRLVRVGVWTMAALGLVGLALAVFARRIVLGGAVAADSTITSATLWPGIGAQLLWLAVLTIALTGSVGLSEVVGADGWGWRRIVSGLGLVAIAATVVVGVAVALRPGIAGLEVATATAVPAVAVEQGRGTDGNRMAILTPTAERLDVEVVGAEPTSVVRGLAPTSWAADPGVAEVVHALASGQPFGVAGAGPALADLGIGFVSLRAAGTDPIVRTLDATAGLTRLGSTDGQILWRVLTRPSATAAGEAVNPSRARLTTAEGKPIAVVPVRGPHGQLVTSLPAGPEGRRLVVAESPDWAGWAQVAVDGRTVEQVAGTGPPAYLLPASAGTLTVSLPPRHGRWYQIQLALLGIATFLAVPFGNRRSRRLR